MPTNDILRTKPIYIEMSPRSVETFSPPVNTIHASKGSLWIMKLKLADNA